MLTEYLRTKIYGKKMIMKWFVIFISAVTVATASIPMPRKVVLNADNLEILRLDIMAMEVRVSNNFKEQSDRVVAALDRHGAKLDASGADLRRANVAMATALDRQAARMDLIEEVMSQLINATMFQIDVRPLIHGFESVIKNAGLEARAAADAAREAVVAANATREDVKKAVAAAPSLKVAPAPGWDDWEYWWRWWQASWHTPLSAFFFSFALYQAESRVHTTLFYVLGIFFSPYLAGVVTLFVLARYFAIWFRSTKRWVQLTPCGRYCCPRSDADLARDAELADLGPARPVGARAGATRAHSTLNSTALDTTTAPVGFWAYARGWMDPVFQYFPLSTRNSFSMWYV
jgi:hypothetical protein